MDDTAPVASKTVTVQFSGEAGEYFRIWIVNIALTILTLGVYSAWATVRKRRYFYSHTAIDEGSFDFHASPKAILIGRLIAAALFGAYLLSDRIHLFAPLALLVVVFFLVPWLMVRSRVFNMRNTSYRGIRFNFQRNYKGAAKAFFLGILVTVFTFGVMTPTAAFWRSQFFVNNSGYGQTLFKFDADHNTFIAIFWKMVGLSLLSVIVVAIAGGLIAALADEMLGDSGSSSLFLTQLVGYVTILPIVLVYVVAGVYYRVRLYNCVWNGTCISNSRFISLLSVRKMTLIYLTNLVAIVASFGLLIPWAQIRLAKYRASVMEVVIADEWSSFTADKSAQGSALGDEIGNAFDIEVDIGI